MTDRQTILNTLKANYRYMASEYGVSRIGLFGSFAKDDPREGSDIDVVVEFEKPVGFRFMEFAEYLEQLLGRPVDLITPAGIRGIRIERIARHIEESTVYV